MSKNNQFQKYHRKLALEGILKSSIWGFNAFCLVLAVIAFVGWATNLKSAIWMGIGIGVAVGVICAVILYFAVYRPTASQIAERLDALGLEERMVTMMEFQQDESYIALRQREDAQQSLSKVSPNQIKVHPFAASDVSKKARRAQAVTIAFTVFSPILAVAMVLVFVLSLYNVLPSGDSILGPDKEPSFVLVSYMENDGGVIEGETDQIIEVGGTTDAVLAVADDGYAFVQWSDGYTSPSRSDADVQEDLFVYPEFQEVQDDGEGDEGDEPSDQPNDQPGQNNDGSDNPDGDDLPPEPNQPGSVNDVNNGMIIDGETDYKDEYAYYYELAMQLLNSGTLTPEEEAFLKAYFDSLL